MLLTGFKIKGPHDGYGSIRTGVPENLSPESVSCRQWLRYVAAVHKMIFDIKEKSNAQEFQDFVEIIEKIQ